MDGWIAPDLGMQIWTETEEASRAAAKSRKRKLPEAGNEVNAAVEEPSTLARHDPALYRMLCSRPTPLFRMVASALLCPEIQAPVDVFDLMATADLSQWLKEEQQRHWQRKWKRKEGHRQLSLATKRRWRDDITELRREIGMGSAENPYFCLESTQPASSGRSQAPGALQSLASLRDPSPPAPGGGRWTVTRPSNSRSDRPTAPRPTAAPEATRQQAPAKPRRGRSVSPEPCVPLMETLHRMDFRAVYQRRVHTVLEELAQLRCRPIAIEKLDLGSRSSYLVVEIRKGALYGIVNSVLHHFGEPLIKTRTETFRYPEVEKTHAVVQGYEDRSVTYLTRPQEDQVRREIDLLLDCPSVEGVRQKELDWKVRLVLNHRPVTDSFQFKRFHWQAVTPFAEFCPKGTVDDCIRDNVLREECDKIHFRRLIFAHTDIELGDCSYLDTCRRLNICKFVHYQLLPSRTLIKALRDRGDAPGDARDGADAGAAKGLPTSHWQNDYRHPDGRIKPLPVGMRIKPWLQAQWIQCDIRNLDLSVLGKFDVIMADPPWDIHMELPYGTMRDGEMRDMPVGSLSDEGLIFLWVTGRAMELGRECLEIWGYKIMEEIVWVKINQLQRIIRTGRTGHWLNHSKEHCLVGIKGNPKINKCLDCDVIVSEVRETSRKPDEIYGIIERICPDGRKLEVFARNHNIHEGWISLGNQLDGVHLTEPQLIENYNAWVAKEMVRRTQEAKEKEQPRPQKPPPPPPPPPTAPPSDGLGSKSSAEP
eukprot:EG_transcript_3718